MKTWKVILFVISGVGLIFILLLFLLFAGDIIQYKRIGNTNFYLVEIMTMDSNGKMLPDIYWRENVSEDYFLHVNVKGFPKIVYWDNNYILVHSSDNKSDEIFSYSIITQNLKQDNGVQWDVQSYDSIVTYQLALHRLGLDETKMDSTDTKIPRSLHIFD